MSIHAAATPSESHIRFLTATQGRANGLVAAPDAATEPSCCFEKAHEIIGIERAIRLAF